MVKTARIVRFDTGRDGTYGVWTTVGFTCYTLELPWKGGGKESCIAAGTYLVKWMPPEANPKTGACYEVKVPGRTDILIHRGNFAGDVNQGLRSDVEGCILPGQAVDFLEGQKAVIASGSALARLVADMTDSRPEDFELTISWAPGMGPAIA